jgi:hypothetical protein
VSPSGPPWKAFLAAAPVALSGYWLWRQVFGNQCIDRIPLLSRQKVVSALRTVGRNPPSSDLSLDTLCAMSDYLAVMKRLSRPRRIAPSTTSADEGDDKADRQNDCAIWDGKVRTLRCQLLDQQPTILLILLFFSLVALSCTAVVSNRMLQDIENALHAAVGRQIFSKYSAAPQIVHQKASYDAKRQGSQSFGAKV